MNTQFQQEFQFKWEKYFPSAELPVAYFYTDEVTAQDRVDSQDEEHCVVTSFQRVRQGHTFVYGEDSPGCKGWRRYTGFSQSLRPQFEFFLSCGIPGEIEGERVKKSPDLVDSYLKSHPAFQAPVNFDLQALGKACGGRPALCSDFFRLGRCAFRLVCFGKL